MKSRRLSLAVSSGLLCLGLPLGAQADEPPKKVAAVEQPGAPATPPAPSAPAANEQWEDAWMPWNTGEEFAGMGFAVFGHLGVGNRFDDPTTVQPETEIARNGLRVGATAIFRPIRWFGFGIGYEHADLGREQTDLETDDSETFARTFRDINTLWIDARAYPLRV
ncbi:MAG: hypothetical protein JNK04_21925, partial [Myxococcales bacterium]|nr:hypothetical protein [Myxococcales bacterium]